MVKIIDNFEITFISSMEIDSFSHHSGEGAIHQVHVIAKEIGENESNNIVCFVEIGEAENRLNGDFESFVSLQKAMNISINHRGSTIEEIDIHSNLFEVLEKYIEEGNFNVC